MRFYAGRVAVAVACLSGMLTAAHAASIPWTGSLPSAMTRAKSSNKLVMIDLFTDWCGYCKKLDAETYPVGSVVRAAQDVVPVRMNAEREGLNIARKFHVSGFPTVLFLDPDGDLAGEIVGF